MKRIVYISFLLFFFGMKVVAQHEIKGSLLNIRKEPAFDVHIFLYSLEDTTKVVRATVSDKKGNFTLSDISEGNYKLVSSSIQHAKSVISINNLRQNIQSLEIVLKDRIENLNEVSVSASQVVNKFDKQIIFPDSFEKNNSMTGVELLDKLNLQGVIINKLDNSVKGVRGGSVKCLINGAPANPSEVMAIDPASVTRIEYHDMPSMRYEDNEVVVDFYVKRRVTGGDGKIFLLNNLLTETGNYLGNLKFNHRKSEFSFNGSYTFSNFYNQYTNKSESFYFEDGSQLNRFSEGLPGIYKERMLNLELSYSYYETDNTLFIAKLNYNSFETPSVFSKSRLFINEQPDQSGYKQNLISNHDRSPSFNIYYQKKWENKSFFALDVVGTHIDTKSSDSYLETWNSSDTTTIFSFISGDKYSVIAEGIYEKKFTKGKLNAGITQNLSFADNLYMGTLESGSKMNQYTTSFYSEWTSFINKLNYAIGFGGVSTQTIQDTRKSSLFHFKPSIKLGYEFSKNMQLRYQGKSLVRTPSLRDINDVQIIKDKYEILSGNPELKSVFTFDNLLMLTYNKRNLSSSASVSYSYITNPILPNTFREGKYFVTQMQNGKYAQSLVLSGSVRRSVLDRRLNVYARFGYKYMQNVSADYSHAMNTWYINSGVSGTYKRFTLSANVDKRADFLTGERLIYNAPGIYIGLDYKWKMLMVGSAFGTSLGQSYFRSEKNLSQYLPGHTKLYNPDTRTHLQVKLTWIFNFGRQREGQEKRINNSDIESGVLK